MIRIRRYRVFLFVAVVSLVGVYYLSQDAPWESTGLNGLPFHRSHTVNDHNTPSDSAHDTFNDVSEQHQDTVTDSRLPNDDSTLSDNKEASIHADQAVQEGGQSTSKMIPTFSADFETIPEESDVDNVKHWIKPSQFYPVPTESIIQLPTGAPRVIPRIQHQFSQASSRVDDQKLAAVKSAMERTWSGYRSHAWMHDELRPVSNWTKDPFMGWAATLVDSLDTLFIMGMDKEFQEAVRATAEIDFTTSHRSDIPLFETTIRYLGGLVGAYDVSGGKYPILLHKAVELAEVLIGAFDTPNRMPVLYYNWSPAMTSVAHRASSGAVLAEIGSLSLEFTRLAQLTSEPKYYDAVARITNALQLSQNQTSLPGLWPQYVDASGCGRTQQYAHSLSNGPPKGVTIKSPSRIKPDTGTSILNSKATNSNKIVADHYSEKDMSSFGDDVKGFAKRQSALHEPLEDLEECGIKQSSAGRFTLGGMADSTYEYLPKMHILLGGLSNQYQSMYETAMRTINEYLLYRPMVKDNRDLLFAASFNTLSALSEIASDQEPIQGSKDAKVGHLTCFLGGMVGLGAKIFDRRDDMEKALKLSDGCVWAYESTSSGIMPEEFTPFMCNNSDPCPWNETRYWEALDPNPDVRKSISRPTYLYASPSKDESTSSPVVIPAPPGGLDKRQLDGYLDTSAETVPNVPTSLGEDVLGSYARPATEDSSESHAVPQSNKKLPSYTKTSALSHEEYVLRKIKDDHLPTGFVVVNQKNYILRPEAIESVFYMYRMTGDEQWRQKGWQMFQAVERETQTYSGASAIDNVLVQGSEKSDSMESFWSAETLKYYYLLFSDPDLISLDDFVLNTEAHPLLRPDAKRNRSNRS